MKTLYIYSHKTGVGRSPKKDNKIISKLSKIYDVLECKETSTIEEFGEVVKSSIGVFDTIVVAGGDGALKLAVNELMKYPKDKRPILGYLPAGSVNDAGKAFGCGHTIRSGLKNLAKGNIDDIDIVKANNEYINFVVAIGAYSDISYQTKRTGKKIIGRLAYYFDAIPRLFKKIRVNAEIEADGKKYNVKTPFILIMNSRNVGGFPVNFRYSVKDGMVEMYITKPGLFNGLLHYVFFKCRTLKIRAKSIKISTNSKEFWCFDGEKGDQGSIQIEVLQQELKVIGTARK